MAKDVERDQKLYIQQNKGEANFKKETAGITIKSNTEV